MTISIDLTTLRVASTFASSVKTRYYLCGVQLEVEPFDVTYIATDGHVLFVRKIPTEVRNTTLGTFIVPTEACAHFKKQTAKQARIRGAQIATLDKSSETHNGGVFAYTMRYANISLSFDMVDETYPDWRRVLPPVYEKASTQLVFDWNNMARFTNAATDLDLGVAVLHAGPGNDPAWVSFTSGSTFTFGVCMPVSGLKYERPALPAFAHKDYARIAA